MSAVQTGLANLYVPMGECIPCIPLCGMHSPLNLPYFTAATITGELKMNIYWMHSTPGVACSRLTGRLQRTIHAVVVASSQLARNKLRSTIDRQQ